MEQGRGQVVGIIGAPGVGKSGLCYEFTQSQRPPGWLILASSPVAYGKDMPYFQVIDLLKAYFQLNAGAERQTIRDTISGKLQTLCQLALSCGFYCVCVATSETIAQSFPVLTLEQVYGAITFYLAHQEAIDRYLAQQRTAYAAKRQAARQTDPMFYQKMAGARRQLLTSP